MHLLKEEDYPAIFLETHPPVSKIYYQGDVSLLKKRKVSVVGSRHPTRYGLYHCRKIVEKLIRHDIVIVSGFARGIDFCSHKTALDAEKSTIAVLACGLDIPYPAHRRKVEEAMQKRGLYLSEYPSGTTPKPWNFAARNRLISALGEALIVIECVRKSGSMITAHHALEQGRDVWALPGPVDSIQSEGTNYLIAKGAYPLIDLDILMEELLRRKHG